MSTLSIFLPGGMLPMPLQMENLKYDGVRVYTNKPYAGVLIGHTSPQTRFAFDQVLDMAAEAIGMDPLELRLRNALKTGNTTVHGYKITSYQFIDSLRLIGDSIGWKEKRGKHLRDGTKRSTLSYLGGMPLEARKQCKRPWLKHQLGLLQTCELPGQ